MIRADRATTLSYAKCGLVALPDPERGRVIVERIGRPCLRSRLRRALVLMAAALRIAWRAVRLLLCVALFVGCGVARPGEVRCEGGIDLRCLELDYVPRTSCGTLPNGTKYPHQLEPLEQRGGTSDGGIAWLTAEYQRQPNGVWWTLTLRRLPGDTITTGEASAFVPVMHKGFDCQASYDVEGYPR